jgi:N6-L-threonylcarbamoyladenine synthase
MLILTIESTCDETAAAVINDQLEVLGEVVASQESLHELYDGVVPEIAARAHLERMIPVIDQTLKKANKQLTDLDAIAVAHTPGLAGSLLIGLSAAKALSLALDVPLIGINHIHGHIYACQIGRRESIFPCVGFVVSGGHTNLFACQDAGSFRLLGSTIDDAAGEAFDKVASMLGLPFPGGPALSRLATEGNPTAFRFPRPFLHEPDRLQFSFSGLKTAVRYELAAQGKVDFRTLNISEERKRDIAASFQEAVVDCLVEKSLAAVRLTGWNRLCIGGGVAANRRFRESLAEKCGAASIELLLAPPKLCTDNAVLGAIAIERLKRGDVDDLWLDIRPGLERAK